MAKKQQDGGLPKAPKISFDNSVISYTFPEGREIFWGSDQYIEDNVYSPPSGWKYNECLVIPKIVRFLHDAHVYDPEPQITQWQLYATCITQHTHYADPMPNLPPGDYALEYGWRTGYFSGCGIPRRETEPYPPCTPTLYEEINKMEFMLLSIFDQCEKYNEGRWVYKGTIGGAIAGGFLIVDGYVTVWQWRILIGPGQYAYTQTYSCGDMDYLNLPYVTREMTASPKVDPTYRDELPWYPRDKPNCPNL